jgi:hypothetical protein
MRLDNIPLWLWFVGSSLVILLAIEGGFDLGRRQRKVSPGEKESPAAAMGGAILGLVAFMLAFTFGIASGRFDTRKEMVREEADAIRDAYTRAAFLDKSDGDEARALLRGYVDARVELARQFNATMLGETLGKSSDTHDRLWAIAEANARKDLNSDTGALFVESINDVMNIHARRVAVGVETRIPVGIWAILYVLATLGMLAIGFQAGIAGSRRSVASLMLSVSFALVMTLIAGLDRPNTPFVSVTQKPLADVRAWMDRPAFQDPPSPGEQ